MSIHDTDSSQRRIMRVHWRADDELWHGQADVSVDATDDAVGRSGPAGVVRLSEGELSVSLCYLVGRAEEIRIPRTLNEAQQGLLQLLVRGPMSQFDVPRKAGSSIGLEFRPTDTRSRLDTFLFARLLNELDIMIPPSAGDHRLYTLLELAVTSIRLHDQAPNWMTQQRLAGYMSDARNCLEMRSEQPEVMPLPTSEDPEIERIRGRLEQWISVFSGLARAVEGSSGSAARDASYIVEAITGALPGARPPDTLTPRSGDNRAIRAEPVLRLPLDEPPSASSFKLRLAQPDDPPGPDATLAIDVHGTFRIPELLCHPFDIEPDDGELGATGQLFTAEGSNTAEVVIPATTDASLVKSRWAILYSAAPDSDLTVIVGATPLRLTTRQTGSTTRGSTAQGRKFLTGTMFLAAPPDRVSLTAHPAVPSRPKGRVPSIADALDAARRACRKDLSGVDGSADWSESALGWLHLGMLYRAAWAYAHAERSHFAAGFEADEDSLPNAEAILQAVLSSGAVPDGLMPSDEGAVPMSWIVGVEHDPAEAV